MFDLQPPRHISTLRISPVAAHSGDRPFSERIAGTQPWRREPLFMPEAVEKRISGGGRRAVFRRRKDRDAGRQTDACGLSEAIRF